MPRYVNRLQLFEGKEPLFCKYNLDEEIAKIHRRRVPLKAGGSIVIDQTEALVAIDVNSGSFRAEESAEETAYQMNIHAAKEIARQIRLRDLGGVIVNDFIDMRKEKHRRGVERALARRDETRPRTNQNPPHQPLRPDRNDPAADPHQSEKQRLHRVSKLYRHGGCQDPRKHVDRGHSIADPRRQRPTIARVVVTVAEDVADYLNNRKRHELARLEEEGSMSIQIVGAKGVPPEHLVLECRDAEEREIKLG